MTALAVAVVLTIPVAGLCLLLHLATLLERRRQALIARQVALTDAIHGVLGPVVAPIVRRGHGRWVGVLPVPAGHPEIGLMVEIAQAQLGPTAEVVVLAQEPRALDARRAATAAPVAA